MSSDQFVTYVPGRTKAFVNIGMSVRKVSIRSLTVAARKAFVNIGMSVRTHAGEGWGTDFGADG